MRKLLLVLFIVGWCNLFAQKAVKVAFHVQKEASQILYIEQVVEDTTGVVTTTRLPITDSLVAVNFIMLNMAKIDTMEVQIGKEMDRLDVMTEQIRSQWEQIRVQRQALTERRRMDVMTRKELERIKGKL